MKIAINLVINSMNDSRYSFDWDKIYKIKRDEQDSKKK